MEQARLKYRIVGGVVLLALAAILVPVLNDVRKPLPQGPQAIDIPREPADGMAARLAAEAEAPPDVPEPLSPPAAEDAETTPQAAEPAAAAPTAPIAPVPAVKPEPAKRELAKPEPAKPVAKAAPAPVAKPAPVVAQAPAAGKAEPIKPAPTKPAVTASAAAVAPKPAAATAPAAKAESAKPAATAASAPVAAAAPKSVASAASAKPVVTAAAAPASAAAPKPSPAAAPTHHAWVVQLGVYGNVKTAIDLRERLRKAGYSAFTEEVSTPSGKALRVRVGPELDRAAAQALLARLERETGHQGMVMSYP